ncbi:serine hydrolase domain-containing protein [Kribbella solani]|uniref:CubicO group peptidase (Beta-lactamase class C family) n=1 Tax=Kribbella solani TaxID=236067 RepID=A0A841DFH0_9ACTN|nr:serine hydrolase domain-containing protein [Kribbella solani]MBB5977283.1 CubicO group peptidase (beta-lactamase class C family) [Kribbella solani]
MTVRHETGESVHAGLETWVDEELRDLAVPGLAVGVRYGDREQHVFRGITSVDNPLEVNESTVFHWASVTKTFTATLVMHLVDRGQVELDAPIRRYLPELSLRDADVRVLHLLNHTAGWTGDVPYRAVSAETAASGFLEALGRAPQLTPPGTVVSYNNAAYIVAGRLVEKVTGTDYAGTVRDLLLEPLALRNTFADAGDVMTRRFAVGHELREGTDVVVGPWPVPAYARSAGGLSGTSADLLAWARFHLNDAALAGREVLAPNSRVALRTATAQAQGSELGDATGIGWLLRDVGGTAFAGHSGVATGQVARLDIAPAHDFALCILTNSGTFGPRLVSRLRRKIVQELLGVDYAPPRTRPFTAEESQALSGRYATEELVIDVAPDDHSLALTIRVAPRDPRTGERDLTDEVFAVPVGVAVGESDRHIVGLQGQFAGVRGRFLYDESLGLDALDFGGRLALRETTSEVR